MHVKQRRAEGRSEVNKEDGVTLKQRRDKKADF